MSDPNNVRILLTSDAETIATFARTKIDAADAMEAEMASWTARWRPEALAHYLPQGWSFGAFDSNGGARGIILGQPLLFHRGLTQTLWVEELIYDDVTTAHALIDVAYRWARDKHLQCVLMEARPELEFILHEWKNIHRVGERLLELRSAKY